jgi:CysZ protein
MELLTEPLIDHLPRAAIAQFFYGAAYPLRGLLFIRRHGLWRLVAVPLLVHILLFVSAAVIIHVDLVPYLSDWLGLLAEQHRPAPEYLETARFLWGIGHLLLWVIMLPLSFVLAALLVLSMGQFLCGPWLDLLAERVESICLQRATKPWTWRRGIEGLMAGLADLFVGPFYLGVIYLPLLLLSLLPGVGGVFSVFAGTLFIAHQCFAYTLGRASLSYRARWAAVVRNRWLCGGFGVATLLLLIVPFMGLMTLPVATVGGTLLCCDLLRAGRVRPAAS